MSLIAAFDIVALAGFVGALTVGLYSRSKPSRMNRTGGNLLLLSMGLMSIAMFSNVLEHLGITGRLDVLEDTVEILFFPLIGYALYMINVDAKVQALRAANVAAKASYNMFLSVLDSMPVGTLLLDRSGGITFANEQAKDTLGLSEDPQAPYLSSRGAMVPKGIEPEAEPRSMFHASILDRRQEGDVWELVDEDKRESFCLMSSPVYGQSVETGGSVVVLLMPEMDCRVDS